MDIHKFCGRISIDNRKHSLVYTTSSHSPEIHLSRSENSLQHSGVQRGCGRCNGPRHPPWGHPRGQFLLKKVGKWHKMREICRYRAWCSTGGGIQGANCPEIWQLIKRGHLKFCGTNRKYFRGHPRTSLAPGIQPPLHATATAEVLGLPFAWWSAKRA